MNLCRNSSLLRRRAPRSAVGDRQRPEGRQRVDAGCEHVARDDRVFVNKAGDHQHAWSSPVVEGPM